MLYSSYFLVDLKMYLEENLIEGTNIDFRILAAKLMLEIFLYFFGEFEALTLIVAFSLLTHETAFFKVGYLLRHLC